jgi:adenylate cyclase
MAAGVPLSHATLYAATLHPQIGGFGWRWWRERTTGEVGAAQADEPLHSALGGPIEHGAVRRHRQDGTGWPLPEELRAAGCTEYLTVPLNHIGRRYPAVGWATDRASGFADTELALLAEVRPALAAVVEAIMTLRTARGLFVTYHGRQVSDRVIDGQVRRGQVEPLRAVIMVTDLRGFTSLADRLPAEALIGLLDDYFQVVASAVQMHGGTVLKFIGDGVLAVFSTDGEPDQAAARAAVAAARRIVAALAAHKIDGQPIRAGIALHVGTVLYGNVGSSDRLDFTVIGPAVNLAFRLEALTKQLGHPVLASHAFAEAAAEPLASLGPHPIRGFRGLEEVFRLPELSPALSRGRNPIS